MIALLLVSSHRKDMSDKEGKNDSMTLGIVSPIITQKATIPPKALCAVNTCAFRCHENDVQEPLRQGYSDKTRFTKAMLYRCLK